MKPMRTASWLVGAVAVVVLLGTRDAIALINPSFTPIHLAQQSDLILDVAITMTKEGIAEASIVRSLKGKPGGKTFAIDFTTCAKKEWAAATEKTIRSSKSTKAVFFAGSIQGETPASMDDAPPAQKGYLFINGSWLVLSPGAKGGWNLNDDAYTMLGTWQGGCDMFVRALDYVLIDPNPELPVRDGVSWAAPKTIGNAGTHVTAVMPIDLALNGNWALLITSADGDRLFEHNQKTGVLAETTAAHKLASKSSVVAWADFNHDGMLDLASWNSGGLSIYTQDATGVFTLSNSVSRTVIKPDVVSLCAVDVGGKAGLVIGTVAGPLLWTMDSPAPQFLAGGGDLRASLGSNSLCYVVADLNADGLPDILELLPGGSLIYKGKAPGTFEPAQRCTINPCADRKANLFLGDFDADGLLDVFTISESSVLLWQNCGNFKFEESFALTGEMSYKVAGGDAKAIGGATCDFNNDDRQDVVLFHGSAKPELFFNRGFRSFGFGTMIEDNLIPSITQGQQGGAICDFNRDGAQDLVFVLNDGKIVALYQQLPDSSPALGARGALGPTSASAGPLLMTGWKGERCVGAWNILPGVSEAFVGMQEAGKVAFKWHPSPATHEVTVENKPVRFVVP